MFHITPFFELSYTLLTTDAHGWYEVTKKFQRYRQYIEVWGKIFVFDPIYTLLQKLDIDGFII